MFAAARGQIRDGLCRQIHAHLCLRLGSNALEELLLEGGRHDDRQHEAVQQVIAVDISKTAADNHAHAVAGNGPCSVFARGAAAPVLACHNNLMNALMGSLAEFFLIHDEIMNRVAAGVVAQVVHEGIAEKLRVARSAGQIAGRDDEVRVAVVDGNGDAGGGDGMELLVHHGQ